MTDALVAAAAGFLAGMAGSLGLGGGGFLIIYLTLFANTGQLEAQGINLLFFIPCALVSVLIHKKSGLIDKGAVKKSMLTGISGAVLGAFLSGVINTKWLGMIFGILLISLGLKTIWDIFFSKKRRISDHISKSGR